MINADFLTYLPAGVCRRQGSDYGVNEIRVAVGTSLAVLVIFFMSGGVPSRLGR